MKILVTGGTGFIGSNLCGELLNQGHVVYCMDNNFTGRMANIADYMENPNFEFIEHDVIDLFSRELPIDQIYHLACPASPLAYQQDPIKTIKTNIFGTMNMLEYARKYNARILLSSTSEVYGDPQVTPQVEEYWGNVNPIGPRSCYDEGKRMAETLMMEYHKKYNVSIRIARIFNTYGPKMDKNDGRVVSNFINQCLEGKDITIYGNGNQTRSLCYITDMVRGLMSLMDNDITMGPINLGNPCEMSVKDIALFIRGLTQSDSRIVHKELPQDDPMQRRPNIDKAMQFFHWEPVVELKNGIRQTIEYFS